MKRLLLISFVSALMFSCGTKRQVEKSLHTGNYDYAINEAIEKLRVNKDARRKQEYVALLGDAFIKAEARDRETIAHMIKDGNPANFQPVYELYVNLDKRQERIKPLLPLYLDGKPLDLKFSNYDAALIEYRDKTSGYLYAQAQKLLPSNEKLQNREVFGMLQFIDNINPNYKDVRNLMDLAYQKGTDHVLVRVSNMTQQVIPTLLEQDLLNFNTFGLNDFWTVYHSAENVDMAYDYHLELQLRQLNIAPERVNQQVLLRQKDIKDGWEYEKDRRGNILTDSLGNKIKKDKFVKVAATVMEFSQLKTSQIVGNVIYLDAATGNMLQSHPLDSQFIFSNIYAKYIGDKRALTDEDLRAVRNQEIPFPSNEQMLFDTGEDLKIKLKSILQTHHIVSNDDYR